MTDSTVFSSTQALAERRRDLAPDTEHDAIALSCRHGCADAERASASTALG